MTASAPETEKKVKKDTRLDLARHAYTHGERLTCRLASCGARFAYDPEDTTQFYCSKAHAVESYVAKHPDMFSPGYKDRLDRELAEQSASRARRADAGRERLAALRATGRIGRPAAGPDAGADANAGRQKMLAAAQLLGPAGTAVTYAGKNADMRGKAGTVVGYGRDGGARVSFNGRMFSCSPLSLSPVTSTAKTKPVKRKEG